MFTLVSECPLAALGIVGVYGLLAILPACMLSSHLLRSKNCCRVCVIGSFTLVVLYIILHLTPQLALNEKVDVFD